MEVAWIDLDAAGSMAPARLPMLELGATSGPPIVLIPGLTDGLYPVADPAGRALYAEVPVPMDRCRGLVVSYRHPLSSTLTTRDLADDVAAVLKHRLDRPAVVIAHSMGTMVAQHLAAAYPGMVAGLVLSAPLLHVDPALRAVVGRWAALVRGRQWAAFADDALASSYTGDEVGRRRALRGALPDVVPEEGLAQ